MKTLVCAKPGLFEYREQPKPLLQKGQAILRIKRIGICGTDLHAFQGTQPYFEYPRVLGHELAADLQDADGATGFEYGEAVTFIPYYSCGQCIACRAGKTNCCVRIRVCGVHVDGGMTEYLSVPVNALIKNHGLGYDQLTLIEPFAIAAHGVRRAKVEKDEFVLVIGAGPIGLATMEMAKHAGGKVIAIDVAESRLNFASRILGIPHTVNAATVDAATMVKEITNGDMCTVVIDATGNQKAINGGLYYVAHGGRYVLIGLQQKEISFSHPEFHKRETTLMSSRNATREDFEQVMNAIQLGVIDPARYITHRAGFDRAKDDFENWLDPASGIIKAVIDVD